MDNFFKDLSLNILLIEDNTQDVFLFKEILLETELKKSRVINVPSLSEAYKLINKKKFDVIMLDLGLPDSMGIETYTELSKKVNGVPVIVLTGHSDKSIGIHAVKCGAQDFLPKAELNESLLSRSIMYAIERVRMIKRLKKEMEIREAHQEKLEHLNKMLLEANLKLEKLSNMDSLTSVANRRFLEKNMKKEWARALRDKSPMSLLMIDIDYFKKFNDTYGHVEGDVCLKRVVRTLKNVLKRPGDLIARYGGEEFVVLLPNTDLEGSLNVAEKMRLAVMDLKIEHEKSDTSNVVTVSIGVYTAHPDNNNIEYIDFIDKADKMLYQAKEGGRNRVKGVSA